MWREAIPGAPNSWIKASPAGEGSLIASMLSGAERFDIVGHLRTRAPDVAAQTIPCCPAERNH